MKTIHGGYKKGIWMHDPDCATQEEISFLNEGFRRVGKVDPRWLKLIWEPKKQKPKLHRIK